MGGSSKKQTIGYRYYVGMHIALCHGPVDGLHKIEVADREVWPSSASVDSSNWFASVVNYLLSVAGGGDGTSTAGPVAEGRLVINAPTVFGGDSREGGIVGAVDFEPGGPTQGQNDYLAAKLGADLLPSFRGVCCVVLRQVYMGLNPYLKKWMFRVQRIHNAQEGAVQWYNEKAAIAPVDEITKQLTVYAADWKYNIVSSDSTDYSSSGYDDSAWSTGQSPFCNTANHPYAAMQGFPLVKNTAWPTNTKLWLRKTFTLSALKQLTFTLFVDNYVTVWVNGIEVVPRSGTLSGAPDGAAYFHVVTVSHGLVVGENHIAILCEDFGGYNYAACSAFSYLDMNPAHIIRECQTDTDWGMGISSAEISDEQYVSAADRLFDESMGISILWNQQTSIDAFVSEILRHIDADIAVDNTTGKFKLKLIRDDYDPETLLELNPSNVSQIADFHRMTVAELVSEVTVRYWDSQTGTTKTVTVQDLAMVQIQGGGVSVTVDYPGFTNAAIATKAAARDLRSLSYPRTSCTLYANRIAASLNKGDAFKLSWPEYDIASMVMRITGIDLGDGRNNKIKIECTQDTFSLPEVDFVVEPEILWESTKTAPTAAEYRLAFEMPYFELVQRASQDLVDAELTSYPEAGYAGVAAVRPAASTINARLYTDSGAGYLEYGTVDFCPSAVLADGIGHMDTVIPTSGVVDIDLVGIGTWAQIDDEMVAIDAISATSITVKRGLLDTVPVSHAAGARIYFWDEFAGGDEQQYVDTDVVDIKLQTVSSSGVLPLDSAPIDTVTMERRAIRPYPPGNVTINGEYFPDQVENGAVTVAWAHRDRLAQTTTTYADWTDGNIGPESGTTYTLRGYIDDVLDHTEALISGVTTDWVPSGGGVARIELEAVRDGLTSWQFVSHEFEYLPTFDLRCTEDGIGRSTEDDGKRRVEED